MIVKFIKKYVTTSFPWIKLTNNLYPENFKNTLNFLAILYSTVNSAAMSYQERKRLKIEEDDFIYGEIEFLPFFNLLEIVKPQPKEVFYDLGSGTGKAVFAALFFYDLSKACGIEFLPKLNEIANNQIVESKKIIETQHLSVNFMNKLHQIQFIQGNLLDVHFSDADIIFINATCFNYYLWEKLVMKLTQLKKNSRIIVTSKKISHQQFQLIHQGIGLMSWGMTSINIYKKIE